MRGTYKELKLKMFDVKINILTWIETELYLNEKYEAGGKLLICSVDKHIKHICVDPTWKY